MSIFDLITLMYLITVEKAKKNDRTHGTKMVLEQYIKWLDLEDEHFDVSIWFPSGNMSFLDRS